MNAVSKETYFRQTALMSIARLRQQRGDSIGTVSKMSVFIPIFALRRQASE
jgi:hypothetical protein